MEDPDQSPPSFQKGEKVLIAYKDGKSYLAKVLQVRQDENQEYSYRVHYIQYNARNDEWVPEAKIQKDNETDPVKIALLKRGKGAILSSPSRGAGPAEIELREHLERVELKFSKKDIPIPDEVQYLKQLMNANEKFVRNLCWKVFFAMNPDIESDQNENFGIKSG